MSVSPEPVGPLGRPRSGLPVGGLPVSGLPDGGQPVGGQPVGGRSISRRGALGLALAACGAVTAACSSAAGGAASSSNAGKAFAPRRVAYGHGPAQYGDLYLPSAARGPGVIVVIHGGFWRSQYTASLGAPLAADLARRGWAAWNLEYRRLGDGGGWPQTFDDVAAGIDVLASAELAAAGLDLTRVVAVGHSAGGQLAAWAAARPGLPASAPGAAPRVRVRGVVSQAGVLDLVRAAQTSLGGSAAGDLVGGSPSAVPDRYRLASPIARVPLGVPVRCVHSPDDGIIPMEQSRRYIDAATRAGDDATLVPTTGDHFALVTLGSAAWAATVAQLPALVG